MLGGTTNAAPSRLLTLASFALILASIALLPDRATAASGWQIVLDRPTPNFGAVDFVSDTEGWMPAGAGLLHTTDGGVTWTEQAALDVRDVDMVDEDHGWAVGRDGTIFGTADGGDTWLRQPSGTFVHLRDVDALSSTEAWAVGAEAGYSDVIEYPFPTALLHTIDGGLSWQRIATPENTWFHEVTFVGKYGWAAGMRCCPGIDGTSALLHTDDGGLSWTLLESSHAGEGMRFFNSEDGWSQGYICNPSPCRSALLASIDGGVSWTEHTRPMSSFLDAIFESPTTALALVRDCSDGVDSCDVLLARTTDGAITWNDRAIDGVPPAELHSLRLAATAARTYVTGSGVALYSADTGSTWHDMRHPALSLGQLDLVDGSVGYGASLSTLHRTTDGGRMWERIGPLPASARAFKFLDRSHGFAASSTWQDGITRASIYETHDGGETWSLRFESSANDYYGMYPLEIQFANDMHGWVFLDAGALVTSDGGRTWREELRDQLPSVQSGDVAGPGQAWAIAYQTDYSGYEVLRWDSATSGWTAALEVRRVYGQPMIDFADLKNGWLVDSVCSPACRDRLRATSDGGSTWAETPFIGRSVIHGIAFVDPLNGWLSTSDCIWAFGQDCQGEILHTADGGASWVSQAEGYEFDGAFVFANPQTGWFVPNPVPGPPFFGPLPQHWLLYATTDGGGGPIGRPPGDANCDGQIESLDATLILQYSAALLTFLPCPDDADANRDSQVNAIDAALVLQENAGLAMR